MVATLVVLAAAACRPDMAAWQQRLQAPNVQRLEGVWAVELVVNDQRRERPASGRVGGRIALTLNRERITTSPFGRPPVAFGTYDIPFDSLSVGVATHAGLPGVAGQVAGDSVTLRLMPESGVEVTLVGTFRGDSLIGRWLAHQRAGPDATGDFVLHQRR